MKPDTQFKFGLIFGLGALPWAFFAFGNGFTQIIESAKGVCNLLTGNCIIVYDLPIWFSLPSIFCATVSLYFLFLRPLDADLAAQNKKFLTE